MGWTLFWFWSLTEFYRNPHVASGNHESLPHTWKHYLRCNKTRKAVNQFQYPGTEKGHANARWEERGYFQLNWCYVNYSKVKLFSLRKLWLKYFFQTWDSPRSIHHWKPLSPIATALRGLSVVTSSGSRHTSLCVHTMFFSGRVRRYGQVDFSTKKYIYCRIYFTSSISSIVA